MIVEHIPGTNDFLEQWTAIMTNLYSTATRLVRDDSGATMVEYGVMLALIAAICFAAISILGTTTQGLFTTVSSSTVFGA